MRIVVINHLTLDGVMQAPGRADEDTRGGFRHGGWAVPDNDDTMSAAIGERMAQPGGGLLLGRRSYEDMLAHWNSQGGPYKDALNDTPKFVVSRSSATRLDWPNSTLLHGDVPTAVAELKQGPGGDLVVMGSGQLIRSLLPHGLIDEYLLMIHPFVLGSGQRLFDQDDELLKLQLVDSTRTSTVRSARVWVFVRGARCARTAVVRRGLGRPPRAVRACGRRNDTSGSEPLLPTKRNVTELPLTEALSPRRVVRLTSDRGATETGSILVADQHHLDVDATARVLDRIDDPQDPAFAQRHHGTVERPELVRCQLVRDVARCRRVFDHRSRPAQARPRISMTMTTMRRMRTRVPIPMYMIGPYPAGASPHQKS